MRDLLPLHVIEYLRDRYAAGVANAEATFGQHAADEDSVTGALGQALAIRDPVTFEGEGGRYTVSVTYQKLRGRGRGAPEKSLGADGIFQIEIVDERNRVFRRKGLPFQAKNGWKGKDRRLLEQARAMERIAPGGIVIDYSESGYKACTAKSVLASGGSRRQVENFGSMRRLSQVLSKDFIDCSVGTVGLYYQPDREHLFTDIGDASSLDVITTSVTLPE